MATWQAESRIWVLALAFASPSAAQEDASKLATNLDYRHLQSPVKNQGERGTCSAFAVTAALETFPGIPHDLSEQCLYGIAKRGQELIADILLPVDENHPIRVQLGEEGLSFAHYSPAFEQFGITHEEMLPYHRNTLEISRALERAVPAEQSEGLARVLNEHTLMTEEQRALIASLGKYRVLKHRVIDFNAMRRTLGVLAGARIEAETAALIGRLRLGLQPGNCAIPVGYPIAPDIWGQYLYSDQVPVITEDHLTTEGLEFFGHALTIVGYTDDLRLYMPGVPPELVGKPFFLIKNSWGPHWGGLGGYGFVSLEFHHRVAMEALLIDRVGIERSRVRQPTKIEQLLLDEPVDPRFTHGDLHLKIQQSRISSLVPGNGVARLTHRPTLTLSTFCQEFRDPDIDAVRYVAELRVGRVVMAGGVIPIVEWRDPIRVGSDLITSQDDASTSQRGTDHAFAWQADDEAWTRALNLARLDGLNARLELRVVVGYYQEDEGLELRSGRYFRTDWQGSRLQSRDLGGDDAGLLDPASTRALMVRFP